MIVMDDFSPDRTPFNSQKARERAYYLLSHPPLDTDDLKTWFLVTYEQGARDHHDGIVKMDSFKQAVGDK